MKRDNRAIVRIYPSKQMDVTTLRKALIDDVNCVENVPEAEFRGLTSGGDFLMFFFMNLPLFSEAAKAIEYIKPIFRDKLKKFLEDGQNNNNSGSGSVQIKIVFEFPGYGPQQYHQTLELNEPDEPDEPEEPDEPDEPEEPDEPDKTLES